MAEQYTGSVYCTWSIYGRRASCVITAGHAMVIRGQRTNLLLNVSLHVLISKNVVPASSNIMLV